MTRTGERLVRFAARLFRLYVRSWRMTAVFADGGTGSPASHAFGREIYAIRERDTVMLAGIARLAPFHTLVARGKDGDWATIVATELGCTVVRGSSRHDPVAASMALVRSLRTSSSPAFLVVDGPLGPSGIAKEGIGTIARLAHRNVVAIAAHARPAIVLRGTWARIVIPLPFARVTIAAGAAIEMHRGSDRAMTDSVATRVSAHFADAGARLSASRRSTERVVAPG